VAVERPEALLPALFELLSSVFDVHAFPVQLQQVRAVIPFPYLPGGHEEINVFRGARFVFPVLEGGTRTVAFYRPFVGLLNEFGMAAQGHRVEPATHAAHVEGEVVHGVHGFAFFVLGVALFGPLLQRVPPRIVRNPDSLCRPFAQQAVYYFS